MSKPKTSVTPKIARTSTPVLPPCSVPYRWILHEGRCVSTYLERAQPPAAWPRFRHSQVRALIIGEGARCSMGWREGRNDNSREIIGPHVCLIGSDIPLEFAWKQQAPLTVLYLDATFAHEVLGRTLKGVSFWGDTLIAMHDMQAVQWMHLLARLDHPRRMSERLYLECVSTVLAVHLLGVANLVAQSSPRTYAKLPVDKFNSIHKFVTDNLAEKITLDQLAKVAALSRSHFVRLFKGSAGMSPYHYVVRQRVLRACELLQSTEHRITEIGFAVGFNDVADFNHMFKKFMECSPRQFRKTSHPKFPI